MTVRTDRNFCWRVVILLLGVITLAGAGPIGLCQENVTSSEAAQNTEASNTAPPTLEVATIKPAPENGEGWKLQFTINGFTARGVQLRQVIQEAYGVYEQERMSIDPPWIISMKFDIEAKMASSNAQDLRNLSLEQRRTMLQELLANRFKLAVHHELKELPVFALLVAKNGPKLRESQPGNAVETEIKGIDGLILRSQRGVLEVHDISMAGFARIMNGQLGQTVLDKTGLKGHYDLILKWTPEEAHIPADPTVMGGPALVQPSDPLDSPLFSALKQQLGLRLELVKAPVDTIVIDHVEMPSEN